MFAICLWREEEEFGNQNQNHRGRDGDVLSLRKRKRTKPNSVGEREGQNQKPSDEKREKPPRRGVRQIFFLVFVCCVRETSIALRKRIFGIIFLIFSHFFLLFYLVGF